ncbi:hypothetical protein [uncultured Draconibacterium sp.]|uniref:hypothetical protein n=1 Tax=uncultured Draconibacterium sp. TaxID=1573823 RepID=UPI0032177DFF
MADCTILLLITTVLPQPGSEELWWRILITCLATFVINLPFGYWRGGLRKLSFLWFLAIHAPVPLVILIRKFNQLQLSWTLAPFLLGSFFLGQFAGRKLYGLKPWKKPEK